MMVLEYHLQRAKGAENHILRLEEYGNCYRIALCLAYDPSRSISSVASFHPATSSFSAQSEDS